MSHPADVCDDPAVDVTLPGTAGEFSGGLDILGMFLAASAVGSSITRCIPASLSSCCLDIIPLILLPEAMSCSRASDRLALSVSMSILPRWDGGIKTLVLDLSVSLSDDP